MQTRSFAATYVFTAGGIASAQGPGIGFPNPAINVAVYGAQGDAQVVSTGCTVTGSALTCNSIFLLSDIGKWVEIPGPGTILVPNGTMGTSCSSGTVNSLGIPLPFAGRLTNLYVKTTGAGTTGTDGVVTVRINGASNGLMCTVGNTNTTCSSTLGIYGTAFSAGDLLEVRVVPGVGTGLKDMRVTMQVQ